MRCVTPAGIASLPFLITAALLGLSNTAHAQSRHFPLAVGHRWSYEVRQPEVFEGSTREVVVESREGDLFLVRTRTEGLGPGDQLVRLQARGDEVLIDVPGEGLEPYYLFPEDSWVHRDPFACDDASEVAVVSRDEVVATPAGAFSDCVELEFEGRCVDAGLLRQWWAPGVGLVKSVEDNFAGAVTWVLSDFSVAGAEGGFLRGDGNGDGRVDISDMVSILHHIFAGTPGPDCLDAADVNDDGALDVSDPVFGLEYLFRGGPEPPAPGPHVPGFDGTPGDPFVCGDPPPQDLPGVRLDLSTLPASLTVAEAAEGAAFRYAVVVDEEVRDVTSFPLDAGGCDTAGPSGLKLLERISGDGQLYCLCDTGLCPVDIGPVDLAPGRYEEELEWRGRNWRGPSDTGNPEGAPFPPGVYTFEVNARGTFRDARGNDVPFELRATEDFELLP